MWKISYSEIYKNDNKPIIVNIGLKNKEINIDFDIIYKKFIKFLEKGFLYYDDGEYDIKIDGKKDKIEIGINMGPMVNYHIYKYQEGGKFIYNYLKEIKDKKKGPKIKKYIY